MSKSKRVAPCDCICGMTPKSVTMDAIEDHLKGKRYAEAMTPRPASSKIPRVPVGAKCFRQSGMSFLPVFSCARLTLCVGVGARAHLYSAYTMLVRKGAPGHSLITLTSAVSPTPPQVGDGPAERVLHSDPRPTNIPGPGR